MKIVKAPTAVTKAPFNQRSLSMNGLSVIESCTHTVNNRGTMFLEEHMLLYVKQGRNVLKDGKTEFVVNKGEMVFLKKATMVDYDKTGDSHQDDLYISLMFFLKDEFLQEFIKMTDLKSYAHGEKVRVMVKPVKERLMRFFESVEPYFNEPENIDGGLIKIKMLELLFDIASTDKNLFSQLLQMKNPVRADITEVMETNFAKPVSLSELAYLSGRSLASFKRDFQAIYNVSPSEWIRKKRLEKAKEVLETTTMSVTDVCYALGFENAAHFSRIFKDYFGFTPSSLKHVAA
jgi:AraC family transcriptional regulator, exoenzyme S synthesis regulatory protein ExsA